MNYCALDDAFQEVGGAPSPGCATDYATRAARKEERRKARRCKGPAATYLDLGEQDPDRQQFTKLPEVPPMNPSTGVREHTPVEAPQGSREPFTAERMEPYQRDPPESRACQGPLSEIPTNVPGPAKRQQNCSNVKKFFGAGIDDDAFADYVPDQADYKLQPNFLKAFEQAGVARAGTSATLPNPSVNMYWKPLTTSGAQTSFVEHLPPPGGKYYEPPSRNYGEVSTAEIMKKIDKIFARLDDMNNSSPEQVASEIMMFISSGIFIIFLMDLLVKKGGKMRF
jgi:hypothetical protein